MDYAPLITATTAIVVAIVGAAATVIAGRKKASADAAQSIVQGFQILTGKLQEERVELTKVIERQATEIVKLNTETTKLQRTVNKLEAKLDKMLQSWRRGDAPPDDVPDETDGSNR